MKSTPVISIVLLLTVVFTAFRLQEKLRVVVIGDSNGVVSNSWVNRLIEKKSKYDVFNLSIAGNTIGFSNNGLDTLNTLKNIDSYFARVNKVFSGVDYLIIALGTNDVKYQFKDVQDSVILNLDKLLKITTNYYSCPIILIAPPPMLPDSLIAEKYKGGSIRVNKLSEKYIEMAKKYKLKLINLNDSLKSTFKDINADGVHLNSAGQEIIAGYVDKLLN